MKVRQTGRQIDRNLQTFLSILEAAKSEDNEGKILYVRHGEAAFEEERALFDVVELSTEV